MKIKRSMGKGIALFTAAALFAGGIAPARGEVIAAVKKGTPKLSHKKITIEKGQSKTIKLSGVKAKVKWTVKNKKKGLLH